MELERAGGGFLSGTQLAQQLGVSRNAVWKAVQTLQKEGVPMQAVSNRGYAIPRQRRDFLLRGSMDIWLIPNDISCMYTTP